MARNIAAITSFSRYIALPPPFSFQRPHPLVVGDRRCVLLLYIDRLDLRIVHPSAPRVNQLVRVVALFGDAVAPVSEGGVIGSWNSPAFALGYRIAPLGGWMESLVGTHCSPGPCGLMLGGVNRIRGGPMAVSASRRRMDHRSLDRFANSQSTPGAMPHACHVWAPAGRSGSESPPTKHLQRESFSGRRMAAIACRPLTGQLRLQFFPGEGGLGDAGAEAVFGGVMVPGGADLGHFVLEGRHPVGHVEPRAGGFGH